tara:strand:- start:1370 stop:2671 length:1302 start_codon:yes stop_codon:yes gene_type:complete
MSRDLYGEVLANVLNRKAPQNHFAAYINPDEAAMLRSQGGGVAPGGGQYMANGLPAYVGADIGFGGGGVSGVGGAAPGDTGIDPGREAAARDAAMGFGMTGDASGDPGREAAARDAARGVHGGQQGVSGLSGGAPETEREAAIHQAAIEAKDALKGSTNNTAKATANLNFHLTNPAWNSFTAEEKQAALSQPIPAGGTGKYSPAAMLAGQNAPISVLSYVNQSSASGGYAVNDPGSDVSVPKGYNMGFFPSAMGSLIGLANPAVSLAMTATGYPGLTSYIGDYLGDDEGALGRAVAGVRGMGNRVSTGLANAFSPVTDLVGNVTDAIGTGVNTLGSGFGDIAEGAFSGLPDFGPSRPEVDTMGQSAADPGPDIAPINEFVNVADDSFSVTDGVVQNPGEKEKEYSPIPPDILARILANVQYGRERQRIAREMG